MLFEYKRLAKKISMSNTKPDYTGARVTRPLEKIVYCVIHHTGGVFDSAKNNADYFSETGDNDRKAGAWAFVDREGLAALSIPIRFVAYHCGGSLQSHEAGSGKYYSVCTNFNSVGIELCGIADRLPTKKQARKTRQLVRHLKKKCPNLRIIIRHWDVNGKDCPHMYKGSNNTEWEKFKAYIDG